MSKMTEEQKQRMQLIDYLAKQRGVSREELVVMLERTIREAARKAVRNYQNVEVKIDEKGGVACLARLMVVSKVVDSTLEIDLPTARTKIPDAELGKEVLWEVDTKDFGRIASQAARQLLTTGLQEAEKRHVVSQFMGQEGQLLNGTISRRDKNGVWIDFGNAEGLMPPKGCIPGEQYEINDHITVLLKTLNPDKPGASLFVTRSSADFVRRLEERMAELLLRHTTTLGVRQSLCSRTTLQRREETVQTPYGPVRRKVSEGCGIRRVKYEYDDLAAIAQAQGLSLAEVEAKLAHA